MVSSLENNVISGLLLIVGVLLLLPGGADLDLRGALHPHLHVPLLPGSGAPGCEHEHDRALLPDPGPGDAGGQRHRHRGEHLPLSGGGMGSGHGVEEGHRRGGHAGHRRHPDDAGGLRAAPLLAGDDRGFHGVSPPHPHHHPVQLPFRGPGHHSDPLLHVSCGWTDEPEEAPDQGRPPDRRSAAAGLFLLIVAGINWLTAVALRAHGRAGLRVPTGSCSTGSRSGSRTMGIPIVDPALREGSSGGPWTIER